MRNSLRPEPLITNQGNGLTFGNYGLGVARTPEYRLQSVSWFYYLTCCVQVMWF